MSIYFINKFREISLIFLIFLFCPTLSFSMENPPRKLSASGNLGVVQMDEHVLRNIAMSIFSREADIIDIKTKMCNHGNQMFQAWSLNKSWSELDEQTRNSLKNITKPNEIKSILKRNRFALINQDIISFPEQFADMISSGNIKLDISPDRGTYGIRITQDFQPRVLGTIYNRDQSTGVINHMPSTKLYISFDIQDIVEKMKRFGENSWNPRLDGRITTICIE